MQRKEIIAMILAGGQGSRLKLLTQNIAKPAVSFGGKYRIIDFVLSNCSNSGIDTVGVLTQYEPYVLNTHIGIGTPWDLDRVHGGVSLLSPYTNQSGGNWYKGTANAIYQNMNFIEKYDPEYVIILSGDHIYKMDYTEMLNFHKNKNADATIAVIEVPLEEASRFGIMNTKKDFSIYEFDEKPKIPKSNLASMGIYIFKWKVLKKHLISDEQDSNSNNDFGKNIIPKMLKNKSRLFAFPFKGYWKDVGTIQSLWEANMDLLKEDNALNLYDHSWKIYTNEQPSPPEYIGDKANVKNSIFVEGCTILGEVENSIIFPGVYIEENAKICNSVVMSNTRIKQNTVINKAIVGDNLTIDQSNLINSCDEVNLIANKEDSNSDSIIA